MDQKWLSFKCVENQENNNPLILQECEVTLRETFVSPYF